MKHAIIYNFFKKYKEGDIIKINPAEIKKIPELQNVFRIDLDVKDRIKDDMSINGFSKAHPVHVFKWEIDGKEVLVLCDGFTRYTAATELNLDKIYAQVHTFKSINEAVLYSMKEQFNRRNIQDSELFKNFEILRQQEIDGRKLTAAEIGERLKKSKRHIFKLQEVFAKSTKEQLKAIRNGETSINQVYNEIKKKENQYVEQSNASDDEVIIRNENVQNNQNEAEQIQDKSKRNEQNNNSHHKILSDKQILLLGAKFALIQIAKGKSAKEILNTDILPDSIKATDITFDSAEIDLLGSL